MAKSLPKEARVVIIGGGVIGCSLAYHLTKHGERDVVLLERKQLTCGTTWHAAGLVGQLRATQNMTRLAQYTTELYTTLEEETGQATGFKQNGSISLATNDERFEEWKRGASMAKTFGLEVEVIGNDEIKRLWPLINVDDVVGGVFLPKDGQTNPIDTTTALAKGARRRGAQIFEQTKVTGILSDGRRATGVTTAEGEIKCEFVVNCAGMWGREVGRMAGVNVPLHACEHFYILTEEVPGLPTDLPVLRDQDGCAYYKEDAGKILLGAFERDAKPWGMDGIPEDFSFDELPEDFDHFMPVLEGAMNRVPALQDRRHPQVLLRARELHPGQPLSFGRGAGAQEFLRRLRLQLDWHPVGRRCRQGAGGVDPGRPCADRPMGRGHSAQDAVPEQSKLPARPGQ